MHLRGVTTIVLDADGDAVQSDRGTGRMTVVVGGFPALVVLRFDVHFAARAQEIGPEATHAFDVMLTQPDGVSPDPVGDPALVIGRPAGWPADGEDLGTFQWHLPLSVQALGLHTFALSLDGERVDTSVRFGRTRA